MFSTPKWLLFALIMFGGIHMISYLMETGTVTGLTQEELSYGVGIAGTIRNICFFDYDYLDGAGSFLKFILASIQSVFVFFALKEVVDWVRGRG